MQFSILGEPLFHYIMHERYATVKYDCGIKVFITGGEETFSQKNDGMVPLVNDEYNSNCEDQVITYFE
jgi:hypothetical protein